MNTIPASAKIAALLAPIIDEKLENNKSLDIWLNLTKANLPDGLSNAHATFYIKHISAKDVEENLTSAI